MLKVEVPPYFKKYLIKDYIYVIFRVGEEKWQGGEG